MEGGAFPHPILREMEKVLCMASVLLCVIILLSQMDFLSSLDMKTVQRRMFVQLALLGQVYIVTFPIYPK